MQIFWIGNVKNFYFFREVFTPRRGERDGEPRKYSRCIDAMICNTDLAANMPPKCKMREAVDNIDLKEKPLRGEAQRWV